MTNDGALDFDANIVRQLCCKDVCKNMMEVLSCYNLCIFQTFFHRIKISASQIFFRLHIG